MIHKNARRKRVQALRPRGPLAAHPREAAALTGPLQGVQPAPALAVPQPSARAAKAQVLQPLAALELLQVQQPERRVHSEFFFPLLALCQIQKPTQK